MYSVPKDDPQLIYPETYSYHKTEEYKSSSTILDSPHIYLKHLGIFHPNDFSALDTVIGFPDFMDEEDVQIESINCQLKTTKGRIIEPRNEDNLELPLSTPSDVNLFHTITYNRKDVPNKVIQIIEIDLSASAQKKKLRYKFTLTKENVNGWDVIMGI